MANTHQPLLDAPPKKREGASGLKVFFLLLSLVAILGAAAIVSVTVLQGSQPNGSQRAHLCNQAHDQPSCVAVLSDATTSSGLVQPSDADLLQMILAKSSSLIQETIEFTRRVHSRINDERGHAALADCLELLDISMDRVTDSMVALGKQTARAHSDAHYWLSSVLTNHVTCLDGLSGSARSVMEPVVNELISRARTSLALVVAISPPKEEEEEEMLRKPLNGDLPSWITSKDRRLLESSGKNINANVVVAKDGSGNYNTVQAAVNAAPNNAQTRYVIYVKAGAYREQVSIGKNKKNLMLVGDGMSATVITGSLNVADGSTTFNSATVAAVGDGFIAQDIWFQNTAGAAKHQAVALRVGADLSVINRCQIDAFQDTLYAHSLRQFYRENTISGTVDFIFGDAAVVFQNCQIEARRPLTGQQNTVTAQGRTDPNSATGTSIQQCNIVAGSDLAPVQGSVQTYLGPWQEYSRTVVMQSTLGSLINPAGWLPWSGSFALSTLYYGEYLNSGPGAGTSQRVKWPGYHIITSASVASQFTVAQLIDGAQWLPNTGVTYSLGL